MKTPIISVIAAIDEKRGIGEENKIPWDIPADRKFFKERTMGHTVIMGRNTYESIISFLGKPLPGRTNIVVTRNKDFKVAPGVSTVPDIDKALDLAQKLEKNGEVFFIGGATIYKESVNYADRLYLTLVEGEFKCDTFFPDYSSFKKEIISQKGSDNGFNFVFKILEK